MMGRLPYWRLSAYYLCYFGALGALVPYWGLFLQARGFDALAIGQLMATLTGARILAPMLWGHLSDRSGRRMPLVRLSTLLAVLAFGAVFLADGFWPMAGAMGLFSFFWSASLPQVEAVTFNHLGRRVERYAQVRLWGSVGFILVVAGLGLQLERASLAVVPLWVVTLFIGLWISTLLIPDSPPCRQGRPGPSLWALLGRSEVRVLLVACFLMQLSHGVYYAFYSIYLSAAGYGTAAVGALWSLAVLAEVLIFLAMHRVLLRLGAHRLLLWSLGLAAVRWLLIGAFVGLVWVQVLAQLLHAATFGSFHAAAIHLVHQYFPGRTQGRGQALYNSLGFGVGGALGSLMAGLLWDGPGPFVTFALAAAAALLGFVTLALGGSGSRCR